MDSQFKCMDSQYLSLKLGVHTWPSFGAATDQDFCHTHTSINVGCLRDLMIFCFYSDWLTCIAIINKLFCNDELLDIELRLGKQEQQRVAVGPGNALFMSIRQVSLMLLCIGNVMIISYY